MKAIILAAGRGSRMETMTDQRPKCLVELKKRPLLAWQIEALRTAGIDEIGIVRGYQGHLLETWGDRGFVNARWDQSNMVSSLACAAEWLRSSPCIVSYSDIFYTAQAVRLLMSSQADLAITYDPNWFQLWSQRFEDPLSDAETFRLTPDGIIREIGKKPGSLADVEGQYMGLLRFTPAAWRQVEELTASMEAKARDRLDMTSTLQKLTERKGPFIHAIPYSDWWGEVDNQHDLAIYATEQD